MVQGLMGKCLNRFFPTASHALSKMTLRRQIKELLQQHYADARQKREASWHWGNCGEHVQNATARCEQILNWQPNENLNAYFDRILPALSALAAHYRSDHSDADGYGLGTVRQIEQALKVKARS